MGNSLSKYLVLSTIPTNPATYRSRCAGKQPRFATLQCIAEKLCQTDINGLVCLVARMTSGESEIWRYYKSISEQVAPQYIGTSVCLLRPEYTSTFTGAWALQSQPNAMICASWWADVR